MPLGTREYAKESLLKKSSVVSPVSSDAYKHDGIRTTREKSISANIYFLRHATPLFKRYFS